MFLGVVSECQVSSLFGQRPSVTENDRSSLTVNTFCGFVARVQS